MYILQQKIVFVNRGEKIGGYEQFGCCDNYIIAVIYYPVYHARYLTVIYKLYVGFYQSF